jgi:hypothetical protein
MIKLNNEDAAHSIHSLFSPLQVKNSPHAFSPFSKRKRTIRFQEKGNKEAGRDNPIKIHDVTKISFFNLSLYDNEDRFKLLII